MTDELTDTMLDAMLDDLSASDVRPLVAALRSERDRVFTVAKERDRAETERADVRAELERERTQNAAARSLLREIVDSPKLHRYGNGLWECLYCHEPTTVANVMSDHADDCLWRRVADFARAALSTQEESK